MKFLPSLAVFALLASLTACIDLVSTRDAAADGSLVDILKPILNFLECKKGDAAVQLLCRLVAKQVNDALAASSIRVDPSGILFSYHDPTDRKIDTGHSCTVTADITDINANAKLLASASIDFSGNPLGISDPGTFAAVLPVELYVRADIKQRFGTRILLGNCNNLGSDSFHASGSVRTIARLAVLFTFAPSLKIDDAGNYIITIKPITKVAAELENKDIKFDFSGISPFNGLATALLGGTSSILRAIESYLVEKDLHATWDNIKQLLVDKVAGVLLSLPPNLLGTVVEKLAKGYVEDKLKGASQQYSGELENQFRAKIAQVLRLDASGERQFIVKKDFVDLVRKFGDGADIWLPARHAGYCRVDGDCSDGRWCNGVEKCVNERCVAGQRQCSVRERCDEADRTCYEKCGSGTGRMCPRRYYVE